MATILGANSIQKRELDTQQRVFRPDTSGAGEIAGTLAKTFEEERVKQTNKELAIARTQFQITKIEQDNAYDQDDDEDTIGDRYQGGVMDGLGRASMSITDGETRNAFIQESQVAVEQGKARINQLAFKKKTDKEIATANAATEVMINNAIEGGDTVFSMNAIAAQNDSMAERGIISYEQAQEATRGTKIRMAEGRLKAMQPDEQIEALKESWANELPRDVRNSLRDAANAKLRLGKAQAIGFDAYQRGLSRKEAQDEIYLKNKDKPELVRDAMVQFGTFHQNELVAQSENANTLYEDFGPGVLNGTYPTWNIENSNPEAWDKFTMPMKENLKRMEAQRATGAPRKHSVREVRSRLKELMYAGGDGKAEFDVFFHDNSSYLNESDYDTFDDYRIGKKEGLLSVNFMLDSAMKHMNDPVKINSINNQIQTWFRTERDKNGAPPTRDEIDREIQFVLSKIPNTGWFSDDLPIDVKDVDDQVDAMMDPDNRDNRDLILENIEDPNQRKEVALKVFEKESPADFSEMRQLLIKDNLQAWDNLTLEQKYNYWTNYRIAQGAQ